MFRQFEPYPHDLLSRRAVVSGRPEHVTRVVPADVIADQDTPLFAQLRSAWGLPVDDPRWWRALPQQDQCVGPENLADPTVALLERTLAALRAWDTSAPVADGRRTLGRHRLLAV